MDSAVAAPHAFGPFEAAAILVVALYAFTPGWGLGEALREFILGINFHAALIEGMLSFLLFAARSTSTWTPSGGGAGQ